MLQKSLTTTLWFKTIKGGIVFFFFFFFFNPLHELLSESLCFKKAIKYLVANKLTLDGYYNFSQLSDFAKAVNKDDVKKNLEKIDSPVRLLYEKKYPQNLEELNSSIELLEKKFSNSLDFKSEYKAMAYLSWIFKSFKKIDQRKNVLGTGESFESFLLNLLRVEKPSSTVIDYSFDGNIIFDEKRVKIIRIKGFSDFIDKSLLIDVRGKRLFYRGHSNINYLLLPSLFREKDWLKNEHRMINDILVECPSEFSSCKNNLDCLVHMQHYEYPTRLLDVTQNPLVALYFACSNSQNIDGEIIVLSVDEKDIKYSDSSQVVALSSLFKLCDKDILELKDRLLSPNSETRDDGFIQMIFEKLEIEKLYNSSSFRNEDFKECFFLIAEKKNNRIVRQNGAFIIFGLENNSSKYLDEYRVKKDGLINIFVIDSDVKKEIVNKLERLNISRAYLFPEINDVACFLKMKYLREKNDD